MDRRKFLGTTLGAVTAGTLFSRDARAAAGRKIDHLGVQLYTVRNQMKEDFEGTLAKVAGVGYKEVEFAGYFGHSPQDVRAILDRHGLTAPSTHVPYSSFGDQWPQIIENSKVMGHKYIINPSIDEAVRNQPDGWKQAAATLNKAGAVSKKAGVQLGYHNHWIEFRPTADGKLPYDILLAECDPDLVKMEMDICWVKVGGHDPVTYLKKYPGHFPLVHVKDMTKFPKPGDVAQKTENQNMTDVGSGVSDWKRIFGSAKGIEYYIVEHDDAQAPFESIKNSYNYLKNLRF
jgi:sugar phosphate isomerase/epimerase